MRLFGFERRWLLTLFEAVLPSGASERMPIGAADAPMERFVDDLFASAPPKVLLGVRLTTWLLTFAPLFVIGRMRTMRSLNAADRARVLTRLGHHRLYLVRELPTLIKMLATMAFCGIPHVQRQVGIEVSDNDTPPWALP